jgi:hypothetical protein
MLSVRRRRSILGSALLAASLVISPVAARAQAAPAQTATRPAPGGIGRFVLGQPALDLALWFSRLAARWLGGGNAASLLGASSADSAGTPPPPAGGVGGGSAVLVDPNG